MKIYNNIRTYRKLAGLKQKELAALLQIHTNEISDMERQKRGPVRCVTKKEWEDTLKTGVENIFYFDD